MTREEAVKILQGAIKKPNTKDGYLGQAIDMAIKALEQEPCEMTPEIGRWIDVNKDKPEAKYGQHIYVCQKCNKDADYFVGGLEDWWDIEKPNFCPNCGRKMENEDE